VTNIDVCGQHNSVAGRDYTHIENLHLVQQRCEFAERLLARKLDAARAEPCAVCGWTVAKCAASCPCCGADLVLDRAQRELRVMGRWVMPLTITATLLLAAACFNVAFGLLQLRAGMPVGEVVFAGAGPVAGASLVWVAAMWHASSRKVGVHASAERCSHEQ
jgi:hypothetical protein